MGLVRTFIESKIVLPDTTGEKTTNPESGLPEDMHWMGILTDHDMMSDEERTDLAFPHHQGFFEGLRSRAPAGVKPTGDPWEAPHAYGRPEYALRYPLMLHHFDEFVNQDMTHEESERLNNAPIGSIIKTEIPDPGKLVVYPSGSLHRRIGHRTFKRPFTGTFQDLHTNHHHTLLRKGYPNVLVDTLRTSAGKLFYRGYIRNNAEHPLHLVKHAMYKETERSPGKSIEHRHYYWTPHE